MLNKYIIQNCVKKNKYKVIYIVPTRALIYQVSSDLKKSLSEYNVDIKTGISHLNMDVKEREIFVLTPERCLNLIDIINDIELTIDLIFMDEIQKLEDLGRGILFEFILQELSKIFPNSKIVVAGPYLNMIEKIQEKIIGVTPKKIESEFSPIFQLKAAIQSKKGEKFFFVSLRSPSGKVIQYKYKTDRILYSKMRTKKTAASLAVEYFGKESKNLIYAPIPSSSVKYALEISKVFNRDYSGYNRIREFIDFCSTQIHPEFSLIKCIEKGVAYHHGSLPEIVRFEIEDLYSEGLIDNLVCTSTLLEGVNLPAEKMFIFSNKKGRGKPLEEFDFLNLIGRAGRMSKYLYGSIYCFDTSEDCWAEEKLRKEVKKTVKPATETALTEGYDNLYEYIKYIDEEDRQHIDNYIKYTANLIYNKYIKNKDSLRKYLLYKNLSENKIDGLFSLLERKTSIITIPNNLLYKNPIINPIHQDNFFKSIGEEGFNYWLVPEPNNVNFYDKFRKLLKGIDKTFFIEKEMLMKRSPMSINQLLWYCKNWIKGSPYRFFIEQEKKINKNDEIDSIINKVVKRISQNVRFILVKYLKIWSDFLYYFMDEREKEKFKFILSLPTMIEMGAWHPVVLNLLIQGIPRSISWELLKVIPEDNYENPFEWLKNQQSIDISNLYKRYLRKLGFFKGI